MNTPLTTAEIVERVKPSAKIDEMVGMAVRALRNEGLAMLAGSLNEWLAENNARKSEAASALLALEAELAKVREALEPSADTKATYIGEFEFGITELDEDGETVPRTVTVPWTTIKEIMAAIRARAALSEKTV